MRSTFTAIWVGVIYFTSPLLWAPPSPDASAEPLIQDENYYRRQFYVQMLLDPNVPMGGLSDLLHPATPPLGIPFMKEQHIDRKKPQYFVYTPKYPKTYNTTSSMQPSLDPQLDELTKEGKNAFIQFRAGVVFKNEVTFPKFDEIAQELKILADSATFPTRNLEQRRSTQSNSPLSPLQRAQIKGQAQSDFLTKHKRRPTSNSEDQALLSQIEGELILKAEQNPNPQIRTQFSENTAENYYKKVRKYLSDKKTQLLLEGLQELKAQGVRIEFTYLPNTPRRPGQYSVPYENYDSTKDTIDLGSAKFDEATGNVILKDGKTIELVTLTYDITIHPATAIYPDKSDAALLKPSVDKLKQIEASAAKIILAEELEELGSNIWLSRSQANEVAKKLRDANLIAENRQKRINVSSNLFHSAETSQPIKTSSLDEGRYFNELNEVGILRWGLLNKDPFYLVKRTLRASTNSSPHYQKEIDRRTSRLEKNVSFKNLGKTLKPWGIGASYMTALVASAYMVGSTLAPLAPEGFLDNIRVPILHLSGGNNTELPTMSGKVGDPTNSGSESDPNSPDYNAKTHFKITGPEDAQNEFYYQGTKEELKDGQIWKSRDTWQSNRAVSLLSETTFAVTNSFISIPTLKDHELSKIRVYNGSGKELILGVDYEVRHDLNKELNGIYFLTSQSSARIFPTFEPKERSLSASPLPEKLLNLDSKKLQQVSSQLRNAKLIAIADALDRKIAEGPVGVEEIKTIVSENSIYTHEKEIKNWNLLGLLSTNPFQSFTKFIKSGIACGECDMGNAIYTQILKESLPKGFNVVERSVDVAKDGKIDSIGHVVTEIMDEENKRIYRLDATPKTHSSAAVTAMKEFREEVEKKTEQEQQDKNRQNRESEKKVADIPRRSRPTEEETTHRDKIVATGSASPGSPPSSLDPNTNAERATPHDASSISEDHINTLSEKEESEIQLAYQKLKAEEEAWKKKWKGPVLSTLNSFKNHYLKALNTYIKPPKTKLMPRDLDRLGFHIKEPLLTLSALNSYLEDKSTLEELKSTLSISREVKDPATVFNLVNDKIKAEKLRLDKIANEMPKLLNELSKTPPKKDPPPALIRQAAELMGISYSELSRARIMENINLFGHPEYAGAILNLGRTMTSASEDRPTTIIPQLNGSTKPEKSSSCKAALN